jgi:uncharacterized protein YecT (DUF1311 family)
MLDNFQTGCHSSARKADAALMKPRNLFFLPLLLLPCLLCVSAADGTSPDRELQRLNDALSKATTQSDMNSASGEVARLWDKRLAALEKKIETELATRERTRFDESKNRWKVYRARKVAFRADFRDGGSIQPLMANSAWAELTEHRIAELESLYADGLEQRADQVTTATAVLPSPKTKTSIGR